MAHISLAGVLLAVLSLLPAAQAEVWTISNSSLVAFDTRSKYTQYSFSTYSLESCFG